MNEDFLHVFLVVMVICFLSILVVLVFYVIPPLQMMAYDVQRIREVLV